MESQCYRLAAILFLVALMTGIVQGQGGGVLCYTDRNTQCRGNPMSPRPANVRECCLGDGFFFQQTSGDETCSECLVYGWLNGSTFEAREQDQSYQLLVGISKGSVIGERNFNFRVITTLQGNPEPVEGVDFVVSNIPNLQPTSTTNAMVQVTFEIDNVALEPRESFRLTLDPANLISRPQTAAEIFMDNIDLTIIDSDVVTVQFTENDYRAEETVEMIPVQLRKDKEIATSLSVQVTPMNVSAVLEAGLPLPSTTLSQETLLEFQASSLQDFSTEPVNVTFPADEGNRAAERSIQIPIVNDGVDEADQENFIVILTLESAASPALVDLVVNSSLCLIVDVDDISIGFEMERYTFSERTMQYEDTIVLIKENNRVTERTFEVLVDIESAMIGGAIISNAEFDADYRTGASMVQRLRFEASAQRLPFPIQIFEDMIPEGTEAFQLRSRNSAQGPNFDSPQNISANALVTIEDNDVLIVGWEQAFAEVNEGIGTFQLRILFMNLSDEIVLSDGFVFSLDLETVPDTAVSTSGNSTDYVTITTNPLTSFGNSVREQTVNVTITNDQLFELTESFSLTLALQTGGPQNVIVTPNVTVINIIDNDSVTIGFVQSSYSVGEEDNSINLEVAVLAGSLESAITVELSTVGGTANSSSDYTEISQRLLTFNSTTSFLSVVVEIVGDNTFEALEVFTASLSLVSPNASSQISINPQQANITIEDDERVLIGFDRTAITVTEGDTAAFNLQVVSENLGDLEIQVELFTQDGSATDADYAARRQSLRFTSQRVTIPLSIETSADGLTEGTENFIVNLENVTVISRGVQAVEAASRVTLNSTMLPITILDSDFAVVGFSQLQYTVQENVGSLSFVIEVLQGNLQRSVNVTFSTEDNIAVAPDDYTALNTVFSFTGNQSQAAIVNIDIDSLLEFDETFFGRLELLSTQLNVSVAPSQATATIQDTSEVTIGFGRSSYTIDESDGGVMFVVHVTNGSLSRPVQVDFFTEDGTANGTSDYSTLNRTLTFDANTTQTEFTVLVTEDNFLEINETFFGRLVLFTTEISARVNIDPAEATIVIQDNDRAVIGFSPTFTSVSEGVGSANLTVMVLNGTLQRSIVVTFNTIDGTAEANDDYVPVLNSQLTFNQATNVVDVQVFIVNNFLLEPRETIVGSLTLETVNASVEIRPDMAQVEIMDDDNVTIGFTQDAYMVPEGVGLLNVTIDVVGTPGRSVIIILTTQDGVAVSTGEADFRSTRAELEFNASVLSRTVTIEIFDDMFLEMNEEFTSVLTLNTTDVSVMLMPGEATITILDNDRVVIGFEQPFYSVNESAGSVSIGVVVQDGELRRSVIVTVLTEDGTAQSGSDYTTRTPQTLVFDQNNMAFNITVPVLDNDIHEPVERFFGRLETEDGNTTLNPNSTLIRILDDDSVFFTFRQPLYMFLEGVGNGTVCIDKVNPTVETIRIMISGALQPGLGSINQVLTFSPQDNQSCVEFPISDDDIALEDVETLTFTLSIVDVQPRISLGGFSTTRVGILDDDELLLSLVKTTTEIPENTGTTELCVEFSRQFAQPFQFNARSMLPSQFNITGVRAGTPNVDYAAINQTITVALAESSVGQTCFNFTVENDAALEDPLECLVVRIELPENALDLLRIAPGNDSTLCCIVDDDNVTIGFTPNSYQVDENAGRVVLNVSLITGVLQRPIEVLFTVTNGTAFTPGDFADPIEIVLQFDGVSTSQTVTVTIENDNVLESEETFLGNLELRNQEDQQITLAPQTAVITIVEDSADEVTIGFQPEEYTVAESDGAVTLVVVLLAGSLQRNVSVRLQTIPGTAMMAADFESLTMSVEFGPGIVQQSVSVAIQDDSVVEAEEAFFVRLLDAGDPVNIAPDEATIVVQDEGDSVAIGFELTSYTVSEGGTVEVCIQSGILERDAIVSVSSFDDTATAGVDYLSVQSELTFSQTMRQQCVNVTTLDDTDLVEMEAFNLRLSTLDANVVLSIDIATINITENDNVTIGFEQTVYTVREDVGVVEVCAVQMRGVLERPAFVTLITTDNTATAPGDYRSVSLELTFGLNMDRDCAQIEIINETGLSERTEFFSVGLVATDPGVFLEPGTGRVEILDNDIVTVMFGAPDYTFNETGVEGTIEVVKMGVTIEDFSVRVFGGPSSQTNILASASAVNETVTFQSGIGAPNSAFVSIFLTDDQVALEAVESYIIHLEIALDTSTAIRIGSPNNTVINVLDNDVVTIGFGRPNVTVMESVEQFMMCVVKDRTTIQSAVVTITDVPGSAEQNIDYDPSSIPTSVTLEPSSDRSCFNGTILNDQLALEETETFDLRISDPVMPGIRIGTEITTVIITDDSVVRVRFEQPEYTFSEGSNEGTVCLRKDLETTVDVSVSVLTENGSALSGEDYIGGSFPVTLARQADARQCISITILPDSISEQQEEFNIRVQLPTSRPQVQTGSPATATVFIDDAGVEVNDTVVGDPLLNIPVLVPESDLAQLGGSQRVSLCYEIHGRPDTHFNFVTDDCASINAHYIKLTSYLNVIDRVGIRAVELGAQPQCRNISVDLSGCSAMIDGMPLNQSGRYNFRGIRVRQYSERVRIAVPNCNDLSLVVWVICQRRTLSDPFNGEKITANMIKIAVMRGLNFGHRNAHGLLGQFWNVPVRVTAYTGDVKSGAPVGERYVVNITRPGSTRMASFTGFFYDLNWEFEKGPCLYVGNRQGGPLYEIEKPNDRVIEGSSYKNYIVPGLFSEKDYLFGRFDNSQCN